MPAITQPFTLPFRPAIKMRWEHLLFIHWAVDPEEVQPLLPPGLDVDTFEGKAYIALVPFTMRRVLPARFPTIPTLFDFNEMNVRTYARCGKEPGVWFFSLDAANPLAVAVARARWKLSYFFSRMKIVQETSQRFTYTSYRLFPAPKPAIAELSYEISGEPELTKSGTLEHFLVERYTLFSEKNRHLYKGQVAHEPYRVQPARLLTLKQNVVEAAGIENPACEPIVFYAPGFEVWASSVVAL